MHVKQHVTLDARDVRKAWKIWGEEGMAKLF